MLTTFERWEKDLFFSSAEEVQESSDRLESVYRRWLQEMARTEVGSLELSRELRTALGTAKWQLEELERAIKKNDEAIAASEDTRARHNQFCTVIGSRISVIESSLREDNRAKGESALSWVRLDEGEADELASFLAAPLQEHKKVSRIQSVGNLTTAVELFGMGRDVPMGSSVKPLPLINSSMRASKGDKPPPGLRRVASADVGSWNIVVPTEGEDASGESSEDPRNALLPKIQSLSQITCSAFDTKPRSKWHHDGIKNNGYQHDIEKYNPLTGPQTIEGTDVDYGRSAHGNEAYIKNIYGWIGVLRRKFQRSQYFVQYGQPVRCILLAGLAILSIIVFLFIARH